jgi:hypothetical protein
MEYRAARTLAACACLLAVSGCFQHSGSQVRAGLTPQQMRYADQIARSEITKQGSHIRVAVADVHAGEVQSSNTGHSCESGSLLRVTLIGSFPRTGVSPGPGSSTTVHAEVIEADPATGQKCLIGVETGHVQLPAGATPIPGIGHS